MSEVQCHDAPTVALASTVRRAAPSLGSMIRGDLAWAPALLRRLVRLWQRRAAVRELRRLSDRELRDLGIVRGQIEDVAAALDAMAPKRDSGRRGRPAGRP